MIHNLWFISYQHNDHPVLVLLTINVITKKIKRQRLNYWREGKVIKDWRVLVVGQVKPDVEFF